jgi:GAF domain-containing protein
MSETSWPGEQELNEGLRQMAEVLLDARTAEATLGLVVSLAQASLPAVEGASVSVRTPDGYRTAAATSEAARVLDTAQYTHDEGPCVEALRSGRAVAAAPGDRQDAWPEFTRLAGELGIGWAFSLPLISEEERLGTLNLYTREARFEPRDEEFARILADHAVVAVAHSPDLGGFERLDDELRVALYIRDRIGEAKGILMARGGVTSEAAFDMLRRASQRSNRKLRDIAQELIDRYVAGEPGDGLEGEQR